MKQKFLLLACSFIFGCNVSWAQDFSAVNSEGKTLYYNILAGTDNVAVTFDKNNKYTFESIEIPAQVEHNGKTYTVTEIGASAFQSGRAKNTRLRNVVLPNTIKIINNEAFGGVELINFPPSLEVIGDKALWALRMDKIVLNEGLKSIGSKAFCFASASDISIPSSVRTIGKWAFVGPNDELHNATGNYTGYISQLPPFVNPSNAGHYGFSKASVENYLATKQQQPQVVYVQSPQQQAVIAQQITPAAEKPKAPSSDVDVDIPQGNGGNENTFAIIFANENYQEEVNVDYALNDGEMFKTYCQKVLGLPEDNVHIRKDATLNNIKAEMTWLQKVADAYEGQARFIVYYAGHGIPDEKTGTSYLLPVDGKGNMLETGYSLKQFYDQLGSIPSAGVTVFMDACFSGSKRGEGMLASARGVAIKAKPQAPQGKMVVFSAAQGDETAYPFKEKEHGMFTYYLLKKLKETNGNVSLGELGQYVTSQVSRKSIVSNGKSQTPTIVPSGTMEEGWKTLKLK